MSFANKITEDFSNSLFMVLTFLKTLSKKETLVFLELFNIAQGKVFNDIDDNRHMHCFVEPKISHFCKKLNKKIRLYFEDHIKIERQQFKHKKLKGYASRNKYTFSYNTFLGLFLLKYNGFLKNKTTVHNSWMKLSEDEELIYSYKQWFNEKTSRLTIKKHPAINYLKKLVNLKIVLPTKTVRVQRTSLKFDYILPENRLFNLTDNQVERLMNNFPLRAIKSGFESARWYTHKGNTIRNNFAFIISETKKEDIKLRASKKYKVI